MSENVFSYSSRDNTLLGGGVLVRNVIFTHVQFVQHRCQYKPASLVCLEECVG